MTLYRFLFAPVLLAIAVLSGWSDPARRAPPPAAIEPSTPPAATAPAGPSAPSAREAPVRRTPP